MKLFKLGVLITFIGLLYYFASFVGEKTREVDGQLVSQVDEAVENDEVISDDRPPVSITVTPTDISSGSREWKFDVVLDTHSGSLDQDLKKVASLIDKNGNIYQPLAWDGAAPGGHHRVGTLVFAAIEPTPDRVELIFRDVGGISERPFDWRIK